MAILFFWKQEGLVFVSLKTGVASLAALKSVARGAVRNDAPRNGVPGTRYLPRNEANS